MGAGAKLPAGPKRGAGRKQAAGSRVAAGPILHEDTEPSEVVPSTPLAQAAAMAQRIAAAGLAAAARQRAAGLAPDALDEEDAGQPALLDAASGEAGLSRTAAVAGGDSVPAGEGQAPAPAASPGPRRPAPAAGPARSQTAGGTATAAAAVVRPAAPAAGPVSADGADVAGVGPWARCFAEELRQVAEPVPPAGDGPWRVRAATGEAFGPLVKELFTDDPAAERALAIVERSGEPGCVRGGARRGAGRDRQRQARGGHAQARGSPGSARACTRSIRSSGITVLRVPESADGLRAARRFATAEPGAFRELVIDTASRAHEAVMAPAETPGAGEFPLGPTDVVLISRSSGGAALALAQVLACCGAPDRSDRAREPGRDGRGGDGPGAARGRPGSGWRSRPWTWPTRPTSRARCCASRRASAR